MKTLSFKRFGCDNRFRSSLQMDNCRVCGGDGSTCLKMVGSEDITLGKGTLLHFLTISTKMPFLLTILGAWINYKNSKIKGELNNNLVRIKKLSDFFI